MVRMPLPVEVLSAAQSMGGLLGVEEACSAALPCTALRLVIPLL